MPADAALTAGGRRQLSGAALLALCCSSASADAQSGRLPEEDALLGNVVAAGIGIEGTHVAYARRFGWRPLINAWRVRRRLADGKVIGTVVLPEHLEAELRRRFLPRPKAFAQAPGLAEWPEPTDADRRAERPGLPVLLISGWAPEDVREELAASGRSVVLQKPFDSEELLRAVRAALVGGASAP